jgi:hypothetical protein
MSGSQFRDVEQKKNGEKMFAYGFFMQFSLKPEFCKKFNKSGSFSPILEPLEIFLVHKKVQSNYKWSRATFEPFKLGF